MAQSRLEDYISQKRVDDALRERLTGLSQRDQTAVQALIDALNPSANTLRQLLQLADESCARDKIALHALLEREALKLILEEEGLSRKEKQKRARSLLEAVRYPAVARLKERLEGLQRTIVRMHGIRVEVPHELEGDTVRIVVTARKPEDFAAAAEKLTLLAADDACRQIFAILQGEL